MIKMMKILLILSLFSLYFLFSTVSGQTKRKDGLTLGDRVQYLTDITMKRALFKVNGNVFRDYIKATPRNYSVIVMFTAMADHRQCSICRVAHDEFGIVANSFRHSPAYSNKLFFGVVDFDEGSDIFNIMKLNTAPAFIHFPPKGKPKAADNMDIQRVGFGAEAIAKWIVDRTDIQIRVTRPPNYSGAVTLIVVFFLIGGFLYVRRNNLDFSKFYNKTFWGSAALIFTLAMTSGQMWNHIRTPPLIHRTANGAAYIHGSSQGQFVFETYIVLVLNGFIVFGMILMTDAAKNKGEVRKRRAYAVIGLVLFATFFSLLLAIFRSKAHGYPYSFLFK